MKWIVFSFCFLSFTANAFEEYVWDEDKCEESERAINQCVREKHRYYKAELTILREKRKQTYTTRILRHEKVVAKSSMNEYRIYVLNHMFNNFEKASELWEEYIITDCNTLTAYDLPQEFIEKYPSIRSRNRYAKRSYYSCLAHHTKSRVHDLRRVVYCNQNGGCG